MRQELQTYLNQTFPGSKIESPYSIFGSVHIRYELGGEKEFKLFREGAEFEWWKDRRKLTKADKTARINHNKERVEQATFRASTIFEEAFNNQDDNIWLLIYEYEIGLFNHVNDYLERQIPSANFKSFYNKIEVLDTGSSTIAEDGIETSYNVEAKVIIGKLIVGDIKARNILHGIANNEMGFEPSISQSIHFINPKSNIGFYMYDDRGCYVWSNHPENIRHLYEKYNDWIVDYHRPEIDGYFKQ